MPQKVVKIVCAILVITVFVIIGTMYTSDPNVIDSTVAKYHKNTQEFQRTQVSTIILETEEDNETEIDTNVAVDFDTSTITTFLEACKLAHNVFGHAGAFYSTKAEITINHVTTGMDCNGYLGYALHLYGANAQCSPANQNLLDSIKGLQRLDATTTPTAGDIMLYSDHVEVYVDANQVYSWGSADQGEQQYSTDDVSNHTVGSCLVIGTSNPYKGNLVSIYRFDGNQNYTPPQQSVDPTPNPPMPGGSSTLPVTTSENMPWDKSKVDFLYDKVVLYKQVEEPQRNYVIGSGNSSKTVKGVGCYACSVLNAVISLGVDEDTALELWKNNLTNPAYFGPSADMIDSSSFASQLSSMNYAGSGKIYPASTLDIVDYMKADPNNRAIIQYTGNIPGVYSGKSHFVWVCGYNYSDLNGDGTEELTLLIADPSKGYVTLPADLLNSNLDKFNYRKFHT